MTDGGRAEGSDQPEDARAFNKAVDLLALRPHFKAELAFKLERRGFERSAVEVTLDRLTELGYLDDLAAARGFASQRVTRQGWGPRRLTAELARRGVEEVHVRAAVDEAFVAGEQAVAQEAMERWAARGGRDRDRLARYLDRRGFSKAVIVEILRKFAADSPAGDQQPERQ